MTSIAVEIFKDVVRELEVVSDSKRNKPGEFEMNHGIVIDAALPECL
jgi:hypothetical protein